MICKRLAPLGLAIALFFLSILAMGPLTQWWVNGYIKPGVIETASEDPIPTLFQGTILQRMALKDPTVVPMYGSSEFSHGGLYNPTKLFAGKPTGWTPYLLGHAGSTVIIQSLYAGAQDLKEKKIAIFLSAQWFGGWIDENSFYANFSALQAYKTLLNPSLTTKTKEDFAKRILYYDKLLTEYPILARLLQHSGHMDYKSLIVNAICWPIGYVEMAGLEIQDALETTKVLNHLSAEEISKNASGKPLKILPSWSSMEEKTTADVMKNATNNPFGMNDNFFKKNLAEKQEKLKNSATGSHFYPSPEYLDLDLLMQVLKEEGADPIFIIQPVNGPWYDFTGFPKEQRQMYYSKVREMASSYGYALADFSGHEYDKYFLDDPSHPSERGWLKIDETLDRFVHQKS